jgi:hypothetical protein
MPPRAKLLAIEGLIQPGDQYRVNTIVDLNLLVLGGGGRVRSEAELGALLEAGGFETARVIPTRGRLTIFEAIPTAER